jgi:DNA mismatch repair protein MutL
VHDFLFRSLKHALAGVQPEQQIDSPGFAIVEPHDPGSAGISQQDGLAFNQFRQRHVSASVQERLQSYSSLLNPVASEFEIPQQDASQAPPLGFAIAQLKGIYILAENVDGMIVVDMHAAHERIVYERMKQNAEQENVISQPLLMPISFSVSRAEADLVEENESLFTHLGFNVERMGPEQVRVRAVPALLKHAHSEQLMRDVLADLV